MLRYGKGRQKGAAGDGKFHQLMKRARGMMRLGGTAKGVAVIGLALCISTNQRRPPYRVSTYGTVISRGNFLYFTSLPGAVRWALLLLHRGTTPMDTKQEFCRRGFFLFSTGKLKYL